MMRLKLSMVLYPFALLSFIAAYWIYGIKARRVLPLNTHRQLPPLAFERLPLGSIYPTHNSWLDLELHQSASGLAGHLWDFYPFVRHSSWVSPLGTEDGKEYSDLRESFPYWFNGLVHLAYGLRDNEDEREGTRSGEALRLRAQVHEAATYVLNAKKADGWLGPEKKSEERVLWGRFPFLLGLTALVEANATAWEPKVKQALLDFVRLAHKMLANGGIGFVNQNSTKKEVKKYSYGRVRVADLMLTFQWLLERYPNDGEAALWWKSMQMAYNLSMKWEAWYNEASYLRRGVMHPSKKLVEENKAFLHGVNVAQGLKTPAVVYRFTRNASLIQTSYNAVDWTFECHGAASGTIIGDESVGSVAPYNGSELCTTVETIFSLVHIYHALARNEDADRAERATFNALPSMLHEDHSSHQYLTQPNQPWAKTLYATPFYDTNKSSQTFGLEPHYPCCTVNHPQGLPKFLAGSWARLGMNGLAHLLLSPSTVNVDGIQIECRTNYPFSDTLDYIVNAPKTPVTLYLRVPGWATDYTVVQNGTKIIATSAERPSNGLQAIKLTTGRTRLSYKLGMNFRIEHRANCSISIFHGALLYGLNVSHTAESTSPKTYEGHAYPKNFAPAQIRKFVRDWTLTNKSSDWQIAIDPSTLKFNRLSELDISKPVWGGGAPATYITARGCYIEWPLFLNAVAGPVPPMESRKCIGDPVTVHLVPLGSAKLHMVELPIINSTCQHPSKCTKGQ